MNVSLTLKNFYFTNYNKEWEETIQVYIEKRKIVVFAKF